MTGVASAIVGTAVVGAVVQNNASKRATKSSNAASAKELEFAQKQYDDWLQVFGPMQDNLAEYYNNLTPDYIASTGLQNVESERAVALDRINQSLAQRGLLGSGLEAGAIVDVELETAQRKSQVRSEAPMQAAQQKLNFLSLGYGQNPANNLQNTLGNQANNSRNFANNMQQAAGQAVGSAINTVGTALSGYAASRQGPPPQTTQPVINGVS
jgi:hypothetical protein